MPTTERLEESQNSAAPELEKADLARLVRKIQSAVRHNESYKYLYKLLETLVVTLECPDMDQSDSAAISHDHIVTACERLLKKYSQEQNPQAAALSEVRNTITKYRSRLKDALDTAGHSFCVAMTTSNSVEAREKQAKADLDRLWETISAFHKDPSYWMLATPFRSLALGLIRDLRRVDIQKDEKDISTERLNTKEIEDAVYSLCTILAKFPKGQQDDKKDTS